MSVSAADSRQGGQQEMGLLQEESVTMETRRTSRHHQKPPAIGEVRRTFSTQLKVVDSLNSLILTFLLVSLWFLYSFAAS